MSRLSMQPPATSYAVCRRGVDPLKASNAQKAASGSGGPFSGPDLRETIHTGGDVIIAGRDLQIDALQVGVCRFGRFLSGCGGVPFCFFNVDHSSLTTNDTGQ